MYPKLICLFVLISVLIDFNCQFINALDKKPYYCDTKDNTSQIKNAKLKRFFIHEETVYMVFDDKVIFFTVPSIGVKNNSLIAMETFYVPAIEKDIGLQVTGYTHLYMDVLKSDAINRQYAYELYYDEKHNNISHDNFHLLDFGKTPGLRLNKTNDFKISKFLANLLELKNLKKRRKRQSNPFDFKVTKQTFFNLLATKNYLFLIKNNLKDTNSSEIELNACFKPFQIGSKCAGAIKYNVKKGVKFIAAEFNFFKSDANEKSLPIRVVSIDSENNLLFSVKYLDYDVKKGLLTVTKQLEAPPIPLEEFLSCHTLFRNTREVKGIYYDRKNAEFFIFIKRYYVSVKEDLVRGYFYLPSIKNLEEHAKTINFHTDRLPNTEMELLNTKWVKNLREDSYLVTQKNNVFSLDYKKLKSNNLSRIDSETFLDLCPHQTLQLTFAAFCFEEEEYYLFLGINDLASTSYPTPEDQIIRFKIADIFKDLPNVKYEANEKLQFIFNYEDRFFVMMTDKKIYVLEYDKFYDYDTEMMTNYVAEDKIQVLDNYLFKDADVKPPKELAPTAKFKRGTPPPPIKTYASGFNLFLIMLVVVLTILMITQLYLLEYKNMNIKDLQISSSKIKNFKNRFTSNSIRTKSLRPTRKSSKSIKNTKSNQSLKKEKSKSKTKSDQSIKGESKDEIKNASGIPKLKRLSSPHSLKFTSKNLNELFSKK